MTTATARTLRLGATAYPVVLPNVRDPRLHLASVIITIHVLGQVALGFRGAVPQVVGVGAAVPDPPRDITEEPA